MLICYKCDEEIIPGALKKMEAFDVPYINVYFHRECYGSIKDTFIQEVTQNPNLLYNYSVKLFGNKVKGVKNEKK